MRCLTRPVNNFLIRPYDNNILKSIASARKPQNVGRIAIDRSAYAALQRKIHNMRLARNGLADINISKVYNIL